MVRVNFVIYTEKEYSLTSRTEYNYTNGSRGSLIDTYTYGYSTTWKDQMTSYDEQTITYDEIGNPLTYRDGISFTWANGRELTSYTKSGITTNYTYNDSGIRTSKKIGNNAATTYYLNGSSIVRQVTGDKILDFFYDENGNLYGFKDDGAMYYYVRNGQSDIIGILDSTGLLIASYVYDSWGNLVNKNDIILGTVAYDNPFRYRGYYFDSDTELYYLNSRYYDSTVGRFINADRLVKSSGSILGTSMYGYCENNPINRRDRNGYSWDDVMEFCKDLEFAISFIEEAYNYSIFLAGSVCTMATAAAVGLVTNKVSFQQVKDDIKNLNLLNTDEIAVIDSNIIAFYKGVGAVKQDITNPFSIGVMFLDTGKTKSEYDINTVKHEFGHTVQFREQGIAYLALTAAPSVTFLLYDEFRDDYSDYFQRPWEAQAEYYGGVQRD